MLLKLYSGTMIAEFKITNYLSIHKEQTVSFYATKKSSNDKEYVRVMRDGKRLMRVAIIHGNSATGKSAITKAFETFFRLMTYYPEKEDEKIGYKPFLLDPDSPNQPCKMSMVFYIDGDKYKLSVTFDDSMITKEKLTAYPKMRPAVIYKRKFISKNKPVSIEFGDQATLSQVSRELIKKLLKPNSSVISVYGRFHIGDGIFMSKIWKYMQGFLGRFTSVNTLTDYAKKQLEKDSDDELKEYIDTMLKVIKLDIDTVRLVGEGKDKELSFVHSGNGITAGIKKEDESKGVVRFLGMSTLLFTQVRQPSFVIIDDLDKELHPDMRLFYFLYFLCNTNEYSQLLFTTHTFYLLDNNAIIRRDTIRFTEHDDKSETILERKNEGDLPANMSFMNYYDSGSLTSLYFLHEKNLTLPRFRKLWGEVLQDIKNKTYAFKKNPQA